MGLISRLEQIWERNKSYATRYSMLFIAGIFIHSILAFMFAVVGRIGYCELNIASIILYIIWLWFFCRKPVDDIMLLIPYFNVIIHACIYNLTLGPGPAFYLYAFSIIPVMFFLSIRDASSKNSLLISTLLSSVGIILMLATLSRNPSAPFSRSEQTKQFFQVNLLLCAMLIGAYTWEFLTETRDTQNSLFFHAEYDQLTGLRNRYSLLREAEKLHGTQYCVIMCDIDDFKKINDNYGHRVGDLMLSKIGKVMNGSLRRDDILCRWGGEEFLLVIKSDVETAIAAVERIRRKLASVALEVDGAEVTVTMTFGIADCIDGESFEKVAAVADKYLLQGKHDGKNCVVSANYEANHYIPVIPETELDTSHLTSAIFSAFAATSDTTYIYICNLNTNVSRWSKAAVDYFGLPGEYMYDAGSIWMGFVHPDDRDRYAQDIDAVLSGRKMVHDVTYRARNKNGEYVTCICKGVVTEGDATNPALFAGTMTNLGVTSSHAAGR